jgi:hypothetical protein
LDNNDFKFKIEFILKIYLEYFIISNLVLAVLDGQAAVEAQRRLHQIGESSAERDVDELHWPDHLQRWRLQLLLLRLHDMIGGLLDRTQDPFQLLSLVFVAKLEVQWLEHPLLAQEVEALQPVRPPPLVEQLDCMELAQALLA